MHATLHLLARTDFPRLERRAVETLQVNLGYRCNQSCVHCHVNAGPNRTEEMTGETIDAVIDFLAASPEITAIDLTGGAPELNRHFRRLVIAARSRGLRVIDRCNLTILEEPGHEDLAEFLAAHGVEVVASLPCYLEENVDRQRGKGVFDASIHGLQAAERPGLRSAGHRPRSSTWSTTRRAPACRRRRRRWKRDYKQHLGERYGIVFNQSVHAGQHADPALRQHAGLQGPVQRLHATLREAHREDNLDAGDVPQPGQRGLAGLPLRLRLQPAARPGADRTAAARGCTCTELTAALLEGLPIRVADHCYGCTAGQGSSCGGALEAETASAPTCGI